MTWPKKQMNNIKRKQKQINKKEEKIVLGFQDPLTTQLGHMMMMMLVKKKKKKEEERERKKERKKRKHTRNENYIKCHSELVYFKYLDPWNKTQGQRTEGIFHLSDHK